MEAECHNNTGGEPEHDGSGGGAGSKGGSFYEAFALSPPEPPKSPAGSDEDRQTSPGGAGVSLSVLILAQALLRCCTLHRSAVRRRVHLFPSLLPPNIVAPSDSLHHCRLPRLKVKTAGGRG